MDRIIPIPVIAPLQEGTTAPAVSVRARQVSWFSGPCWLYWWPGDTWTLSK